MPRERPAPKAEASEPGSTSTAATSADARASSSAGSAEPPALPPEAEPEDLILEALEERAPQTTRELAPCAGIAVTPRGLLSQEERLAISQFEKRVLLPMLDRREVQAKREQGFGPWRWRLPTTGRSRRKPRQRREAAAGDGATLKP